MASSPVSEGSMSPFYSRSVCDGSGPRRAEAAMRIKAGEVGEWLRQRAGKRDHREAVLDDDYLVLRPGPNFDLLLGLLDNPATAQPRPLAAERSPASDGGANDGNPTRRRTKGRLRRRASSKFAA